MICGSSYILGIEITTFFRKMNILYAETHVKKTEKSSSSHVFKGIRKTFIFWIFVLFDK
ncbi:hypothetical protein LEP1GSC018_2740 [Leptospira kirschneri str. 2008720114]|nr:hypothetical protein LEP1GSC018_2740 [Leptospira kirschneri str. 2008720114]EMK16862.1 hypothetical protein LEP1GSC042_1439 [Leptospira kirschneri serovar Bim str. PUO 1247]EMN04079.1 hypothetical protein LEP1GSC046_0382 [Leptospira kirschneri serovar Bim str. 1051]EMN24809.1 hypothetical protein LEP1GSC065_3669 [Leptospira kirschneri serovar Sokoine str. RM1]